jgi:adenylate cyclase
LKRIFKWKLSPRTVSAFLVLTVFLFTLTLRRLGLLQVAEFGVYDFLIQRQPKAPTSDPIVLVEMTEDDINSPSLDYPIHDDKLAELLSAIAADGPSVIGLDIWRNVPVPKTGEHFQQLNEVMETNANIIAIFTLGVITPPTILKDHPDRLAFNDNFPVDVHVDKTTPKVRRTLLYAETPSGEQFDSFPYSLASFHLRQQGIEPEFNESEPNSFQFGKARLQRFSGNDGAYVGADVRGWQMLLDFKCPPEFTRYSVSDALGGRIPKGALSGKIVIVGVNAPSVADERVTPIRFDHRGIEVQAGTANQLIRAALEGEQGLRFWPDWQEDAWMLLWCALGGLIGLRIRSPWWFALTIPAGLVALTFIAWKAFGAGWWIPLAVPAAAYLPAAALVTSYMSFQEKKQRDQLMQLFSRQVSPDIAAALWEQRDEFLAGTRPRSQKLTATILFTDLVGFTTTSEQLGASELMDWLNEYMEAMANVIMAHDGVIEKYIGDAIMAVFGVPVPRTSTEQIARDAQNAVRCALAMEAELAKLNVQWQERGLPACSMRIGIHTGPLVAGSLGSSERQEYTVLGDSVNTASRLESFEKDWKDPDDPERRCRVLISDATRCLLEDEFRTGEIGAMILKGKLASVTVHHVIGRKAPFPKGSP